MSDRRLKVTSLLGFRVCFEGAGLLSSIHTFYSALSCYIACICVGFFGVWAESHAALTAQQIYHQANDRVVVVETFDKSTSPLRSGSGIVIGSNRIVVQCDLVRGSTTNQVIANQRQFAGQQLGGGDREGLCILGLSDPLPSFTSEIRIADPKVGERVYAVSNALGLGLSISEGVVSGVRISNNESYIQFTAAIAPGSEGGGLFDSDGNLLGFITYRPRDGQNVNFAIPGRRLIDIEARIGAINSTDEVRATIATLAIEKKWALLVEHAQRWVAADPGSIDAWSWLGTGALQLGDWSGAERAYREVLAREPNAMESRYSLAVVQARLQKFQETSDIARGLVLLRKEDARFWALLGFAEKALGRIDEAKVAYERAVQVDNWNFDAQAGLAQIARGKKDWRGAEIAARALTRIAPTNFDSWWQLGDIYLAEGRRQRALACADRALSLAPDHAGVLLLKGAILVAARRYHDSLPILKRVAVGRSIESGAAWERLGAAYYDLRMFPQSIDAYLHAVMEQPDSRSFRQSLGVALKDGFYFAEALALFEDMLLSQPDDIFLWRQIGFVHSYMGQFEQAIPALQESLKRESKQPKVWLALAEATHASGRLDDTRRVYEQLLAIDVQTAESVYKRILLPYERSP